MTNEERLRFIAYCRQAAVTAEMDTLSPYTARRERSKALSYSIVAGEIINKEQRG